MQVRTHHIFVGAIAVLFAACDQLSYYDSGTTQYLQPYGGATYQPDQGIDNVSFWDGDGVSGSPRIHIRLSEQRAYFYKGNQLVGVSMVSTGREGYDTPTGQFKIIQKSPNHRSNLYGDYVDAAGNVVMKDIGVRTHKRPPGTSFLGAKMPYFMRVHGGTGMHAGFLPGYAASHGCIRMPDFMAKTFFANAPLGTPVTITN